MKIIALAAFAAALAAPACVHGTTPGSARLTLTFETGAESGAVLVALFDSEAAYGGGDPVRRAWVDVERGERTTILEGLPAGTYAIKAFHDINGDGRMNTNPFGIPIEPVAFSNNAPANMGAPGWDRARFTVQGATVQTITLR